MAKGYRGLNPEDIAISNMLRVAKENPDVYQPITLKEMIDFEKRKQEKRKREFINTVKKTLKNK